MHIRRDPSHIPPLTQIHLSKVIKILNRQKEENNLNIELPLELLNLLANSNSVLRDGKVWWLWCSCILYGKIWGRVDERAANCHPQGGKGSGSPTPRAGTQTVLALPAGDPLTLPTLSSTWHVLQARARVTRGISLTCLLRSSLVRSMSHLTSMACPVQPKITSLEATWI